MLIIIIQSCPLIPSDWKSGLHKQSLPLQAILIIFIEQISVLQKSLANYPKIWLEFLLVVDY